MSRDRVEKVQILIKYWDTGMINYEVFEYECDYDILDSEEIEFYDLNITLKKRD